MLLKVIIQNKKKLTLTRRHNLWNSKSTWNRSEPKQHEGISHRIWRQTAYVCSWLFVRLLHCVLARLSVQHRGIFSWSFFCLEGASWFLVWIKTTPPTFLFWIAHQRTTTRGLVSWCYCGSSKEWSSLPRCVFIGFNRIRFKGRLYEIYSKKKSLSDGNIFTNNTHSWGTFISTFFTRILQNSVVRSAVNDLRTLLRDGDISLDDKLVKRAFPFQDMPQRVLAFVHKYLPGEATVTHKYLWPDRDQHTTHGARLAPVEILCLSPTMGFSGNYFVRKEYRRDAFYK